MSDVKPGDLAPITPRELPDLAPGEAGRSTTPSDPRCRNLCVGESRPAWDSPAKQGQERGTGRRLVYCPCCMHELVAYENLRPEQRHIVVENVRPGNLNPALTARHKRFVDLICRYDTVLLKDVREL